MRIELRHVHHMPQQLQPGVLYVSKEFGTAHHLCACGCGSKVRTPLGPTEWALEETPHGPTLKPSIGNWQKPCRSHYWIWRGSVEWSEPWTEAQVLAGRTREERRREQYFEHKARERKDNFWATLLRWLGFDE